MLKLSPDSVVRDHVTIKVTTKGTRLTFLSTLIGPITLGHPRPRQVYCGCELCWLQLAFLPSSTSVALPPCHMHKSPLCSPAHPVQYPPKQCGGTDSSQHHENSKTEGLTSINLERSLTLTTTHQLGSFLPPSKGIALQAAKI